MVLPSAKYLARPGSSETHTVASQAPSRAPKNTHAFDAAFGSSTAPEPETTGADVPAHVQRLSTAALNGMTAFGSQR